MVKKKKKREVKHFVQEQKRPKLNHMGKNKQEKEEEGLRTTEVCHPQTNHLCDET